MEINKNAEFNKGYACLAVSPIVHVKVAGHVQTLRFEVTASSAGIITAGVKTLYFKEERDAYVAKNGKKISAVVFTPEEKAEAQKNLKEIKAYGVWANGKAEHFTISLEDNELSNGMKYLEWVFGNFKWSVANKDELRKLANKIAKDTTPKGSQSGPVISFTFDTEAPKATKKAPKPEPEDDDISIESFTTKTRRK